MEQKIQELTAKIYQEGVAKGELQAKKIITDAQEKATGIVANAKAQALGIKEGMNVSDAFAFIA